MLTDALTRQFQITNPSEIDFASSTSIYIYIFARLYSITNNMNKS